MIFSLSFIFNHASDGNSPYMGQLFSNAITVYRQIEKTKRQGCHT